MTRHIVSLAALTALSTGLFACAPTDVDEEIAEVESALEQTDGGMTLEAEPVAFGDDQVMATPELVDAPIEDTTVIDASGVSRYRVLLLWGALPAGRDDTNVPAPTEVMDWTGSVSVSEGAIRVRRTLKFDGHDGLEPRDDPKTVAFTSHTLPHVDGLALEIAAPADATITFDTVSLTASVTLDELAETGRGATPVGNGSGFAFAGYEVVDTCNSGFLIGHWKSLRENLGKFRGRVLSDEGEGRGYIRGIYGNSERFGEKRFFGKYIDADGEARGLVAGGYGDGDIEGRWGTRDPENHGAMRGRYFHGLDATDGRGFWLGRWREACNAE